MNQQQQPQQENFIIAQGVAQAVVDYLVARPFREVHSLVMAMQQLGSHDNIVAQLQEATKEALAEQHAEHDAAAAEIEATATDLRARIVQLEILCKQNDIKFETAAESPESDGAAPPKPGDKPSRNESPKKPGDKGDKPGRNGKRRVATP